jgi:hypothetical protein
MTTTETPTVSETILNNRRNWIHALESGDHAQGRRALSTLTNDPNDPQYLRTRFEYCCIGVACHVVGGLSLNIGETNTNYYLFERLMGLRNEGDNPRYNDFDGSYDKLTHHLMSMNDSHKRSFKFIARFLRVLWGIKD